MYLFEEGGDRPAQGNLLLASLPRRERALIAPLLTRHHLASGTRLTRAHEDGGVVYFPETAVVCVGAVATRDAVFGLGMIGCEGIVGWSALIGGEANHQYESVHLNGGFALAADRAAFVALCSAEPVFLQTMLRFAYLFSLQLADTLLSNVRDPVEVRLCRWVLMFHDRLADNELPITHDVLAALLAVRRATVTDALHILEGERLVICTRGRIIVRSRDALQARAGTAYGHAERAYTTLVAPFGKHVSAPVVAG